MLLSSMLRFGLLLLVEFGLMDLSHCNQLFTVKFEIREGFPMDQEVGDLREKMEELGLGAGPSSGSIFTLMTGERNHPIIFRVDPSTGKIYLNSPLDREDVCQSEPQACILELTVTVRREDLIFLQVQITVIDVNDKAPRFLLREKHVYVEEGTLPGTSISLPAAEDLDSPANGIKMYRIRPDLSRDDMTRGRGEVPPLLDYFQLVMDSQSAGGRLVPTLKVIKELDREKVSEFRFLLVAIDAGGLNGSLPVIVHIKDINDNAPVWQNGGLYRRQMRECSKETALFQLEATDADDPTSPNGHVSYRISEHSADYARINRQFYITGDQLYLANRGLQNFGRNKVNFKVTASDGRGRSSDARVELILEDCNDHAPEIFVQNRSAAVVENEQKVGILSLVTVVDRDRGQNSEFSCRLNETSYLDLEKGPSVKMKGGGTQTYYKVLTKSLAQFDRETTTRYSVVIHCQDHGQPALSSHQLFYVTVLDANDNTPELYSAQRPFLVPENAKQSAYVGRVRAWDHDAGLNGMLTYSLDREGSRYFSIGSNGELHTLQSLVLDREARDQYRFEVIVSDRGSPARSTSTSVTVSVQDVNDCTPEFYGEYYFEVVESQGRAAIRENLGKINATDRDLGSNASIEYRILNTMKETQARFVIAWDGSLSVVGVVDREVTPLLHVIVVAADNGQPSLSASTTVTIRVLDLNDNAPTFTLPGSAGGYLNVSRSTQPNTLLGELSAVDPDEGHNGTVHFSLVGGGASILSRFKLYPDGRLMLIGPLGKYHNPSKLVVRAEDGGLKPLSTVETLELRYIHSRGGQGFGIDGLDSQGRQVVPRGGGRGSRGVTRSLYVFYGLAALLLLVFFCVCGVLVYLYVRTRSARDEVVHKHARPRGSTDIVIRRGMNMDGGSDKDGPNASHEAMLTLSAKTGTDPGQSSTVCVYNEQDNSYTHLTTSLRSPSYTCLPATTGELAYYTERVGGGGEPIYKPWSQHSCGSPAMKARGKAGTMATYAGVSRNKFLDDAAEGISMKRGGGVGSTGTVPIMKSAHSYAFLDSFMDSGGSGDCGDGGRLPPAPPHSEMLPTDGECYPSSEKQQTMKQSSAKRGTPDGLTSLKSPYVTSSFV